MFQKNLAEVYDIVYKGRGKDYRAEADAVAEHVRRLRPDARSLLDVACGTGEHLVHLDGRFDRLEGVEYTGQMLDVARGKLAAGVPLHSGNMCDFDLGRTFDAAISMFASIAYLRSPEQLDAAVACIARHVETGGVLVLEPWYFPERFLDGHISTSVVRAEERVITRVSRTTRVPGDAHNVNMEIHLVVADDHGMSHFTETQVLSLFSLREHLDSFERAGCAAEYLEPSETFPCGLFVGVRK